MRPGFLVFGAGLLLSGCGHPPGPLADAIHPHRTSVLVGHPEHFASTRPGVAWAVDGLVGGSDTIGTIDATGTYHAPSVPGEHTISDGAGSAVAAVSDYRGTLTWHEDLARTGQNLHEWALSPSHVNDTEFGLRFSLPVDGDVYAQPLYVPGVEVPGGGTHNVVYVATEHDSTYAFDADDGTLLWHRTFLDVAHGVTPVPQADVKTDDIAPEIGITSTPVIDPERGVLFVVAKTKEKGAYRQRLHALSLRDGTERSPSPVLIEGAVAAGRVTFAARQENSRAALTLSAGRVYVAFGSHADVPPYHGWLMAYDAVTLAPVGVMCTTPNGSEGGIWMSGSGLAVDAGGSLFCSTSNGTFNTTCFGDSVLKLRAGDLHVLDSFTPFNQAMLSSTNQDLGSGATLLLPDQSGAHPHLLVLAGKQGTMYVLDRDKLGGFNAAGDTQIVESLSVLTQVFSSPAWFNQHVYFIGVNDTPKSFTMSEGRLQIPPLEARPVFGFPGATPTISAGGMANGVLWAIDSRGYRKHKPAVLYAFDATSLKELYHGSAGGAVKFTVPTVANGRVYVGAHGAVSVFGLQR